MASARDADETGQHAEQDRTWFGHRGCSEPIDWVASRAEVRFPVRLIVVVVGVAKASLQIEKVETVDVTVGIKIAGITSREERDIVAIAGDVADEEVFSAEVAYQIAFAQADELSAERTGNVKDFKLVVGAEQEAVEQVDR